jgi:hypothetical protein
MTQIMIEIGAKSVDPVRNAIGRSLADASFTTEVLVTAMRDSLEYQETDLTLDEAYERLVQGGVCSLRLRSDSPFVAWALVYSPSFGPQRARPWTGAIELRRATYERIFSELLKVEDLDYVIVSQDETLDLPPDVGGATFPWNDWRLIRGGFASGVRPNRHWTVKLGPAARK